MMNHFLPFLGGDPHCGLGETCSGKRLLRSKRNCFWLWLFPIISQAWIVNEIFIRGYMSSIAVYFRWGYDGIWWDMLANAGNHNMGIQWNIVGYWWVCLKIRLWYMGTTINKIGKYGDKCGVGQSVSHQRNRARMGIYWETICSTLFNHDSLVMWKLDGNRGMPQTCHLSHSGMVGIPATFYSALIVQMDYLLW